MKSDTRRKAIIHLFESIIAAVILSGYFYFVFSSYETQVVQSEMITEEKLQTELYSLMAAFKYTNASYFIEDAKEEQMHLILKYFIGIGKGYSLVTNGLPKKQLLIGVVSQGSSLVSTGSVACNPPIAGTSCYSGTFKGKSIMIANVASDEINALFVDYDSDGAFNAPDEGPFLQGTIVNISNNIYGFAINDTLKEILFFSAEDTVKLAEKLNVRMFSKSAPFYLNQREVEFTLRPASLDESYESLSKNDILFFYNYRNLALYESKLKEFMEDRKTLFEITTASLVCHNDNVQKYIFNLQKNPGFDLFGPSHRTGGDTNISLNSDFLDMSVKAYLDDNEIIVKTKRYYPELNYSEESGGALNNSIDDRTAFAAIMGANNTVFYFAIVKNLGTYSHLYISNETNFTGKPYYIEGNEISLGSYNYSIEEIDTYGRFVKLRTVFKKYRFPDRAWEMPYVYVHPYKRMYDTDEQFILLKQNRTYNQTQYAIGENISTSGIFRILSKNEAKAKGIFCSDGSIGFPAKTSNISLDPLNPSDSKVEVAVANCSDLSGGVMDSFYIDIPPLTNNSLFNNTFEGPFSVWQGEDVLRLNSEYYKIHLTPTGNFNLTLLRRWPIPVAIISKSAEKGAAVWMVNPGNSSEGWAIVKSTLAAFSDKRDDIILPNPSRRNSLFAEDVFFSKGSIYVPYTVKLGVWYP
ncbi:MAG: hypothetical protein DRN66_01945 [Candidatus Nanohalarchaeota archaeon]|nr:MAG: hypothetical protein DRN66_01945 [Candidatus Nanohaloarchaeota archaeon]